MGHEYFMTADYGSQFTIPTLSKLYSQMNS